MNVRLIGKTTGAVGTEYENKSLDEITVGIARLSSSKEVNELFVEPEKLLRYCITNGHWSVFATTNLIFEIITSRAMGRELLRHWSLKPQEFSQRYAEVGAFEEIELRNQAKTNRQSSTDVNHEFDAMVDEHLHKVEELYSRLLKNGIAKETARLILPETSQTKIIFNGTLRDWITTLNLRLHKTAQKEVRDIANKIKNVFINECPVIATALYNFEDAYDVHILDRVVLEKYGVFGQIKENDFKKLVKK